MNTTSVSTIKNYIDTAISNGSTIVLLFHNIKDSNPSAYEYLTSDFYSIIDYIANSGIDCLTMDDLYQLTLLPINIPSNNPLISTSLNVFDGYANDVGSIYVNPPKTDVGVTITASNNKPNYLGYVTLTIKVTNYGPNQAVNVTVGEWLDGNYFKWISDDSNGTFNLSSAIWIVGTINVGETHILNILVQILASNITINNTATYNSGDTEDINLDNNRQTISLVVPKATIITVHEVNGYKGDSKQLIASLTDGNKNPLIGKTVYFTVNGKSVGSDVTDANGIATLDYILNYNGGVYTILAEFLQDADYSGVNGTATLNILPITTVITMNNASGYKGDKVNLIAYLNDTHNNVPIEGARIEYYINGNLMGTATTDSSGRAIYQYNITQIAGSYIIQAKFPGDTTYLTTNSNSNLIISLTPTNLIFNPINCYKNDKINFTASLKDNNGNPVSEKTISFFGNGSLIGSATTNSSGIATLPYTMSVTTGTYILTALFTQDGTYASSNSTSTITVNLIPTNITITPVSGYKGDTVNLTTTLKDINGNPLSGKTIIFNLNGTTIGTATTNTSGIATLLYTITQNTGNYIIQAIYNGDTTYNSTSNSNNLIVGLISTNLTVNPVNCYKGDNASLTASLNDNNGNPISGKTVSFYGNGSLIGSATTNSSGIATLQYIMAVATGTYTLTVQFTQDNTYSSSNSTSTLTVNLTPTNITVNPVSGNKGDPSNITVTLTDYKGNPLVGNIIYVYINGTSIATASTNDNGQIIIPYTITQNTGTYTIQATYNGDTTYNKSNNTNTLSVNLTKTTIIINSTTGHNGDNIDLAAKLADFSGNTLPGKSINFYLNGNLIGTSFTDINGIAWIEYTITQTKSTNTITASFNQDNSYLSASNSNILVVYPTPTTITVNSITGYKGCEVDLTAILKDDNSKLIQGKSINFYINGNFVGSAVTDLNGQAIFPYTIEMSKNEDVKDLDSDDTYTILAQYLDDVVYSSSDNSNSLTVKSMATNININPVTGHKGDIVNLNATLTDINNNQVSGESLLFYVNNKLVGSGITDYNGAVTLPYLIDNGSGLYSILVLFSGDSNYLEVSNTGNLQVSLKNVKIVLSQITAYIGTKTNVKAVLTDNNNNPLAGKVIYFIMNGSNIGSAITDNYGTAILPYMIGYSAGKYSIIAQFLQDVDYNTTSNINNIIVNLNPSKLTVSTKSGYNGDKINITAKMFNCHTNTILTGKMVYFYINGVCVGKGVTNSSGVASFIYTIKQMNGTYTILASFAKDNTYLGTSNSSKLTVKLIPIKLTTNCVSGTKNKQVKLTTTLLNIHKNVKISNQKVYFYISGKYVGYAKTNTYGVATLNYTIKLKKGTYTLSSKFLSNTSYIGTKGNTTLKVK